MTKNESPDNISENPTPDIMQLVSPGWALNNAEAMLKKYLALDIGAAEDYNERMSAYSALQLLIEKERSTPVGTGLERLIELARGVHSGYIVFTPVKLSKQVLQVEFFHTIRREFIGRMTFKKEAGAYRIRSMAFDAF